MSEDGQAIWDALEAEERGETREQSQEPAQEQQPKEQQQQEPQADTQPEAAQETAPKEGEVKQQDRPEYVSALEKQIAELTNLVKSTVGRVGSLQSELAKLGKVAAAAPTQVEIKQAQKDPEKWAKLKSEFPDWGEAVEEFVATRAPDPSRILETAQRIAEEKATAAAIKAAKDIASLAEPDWEEVVQSDEFDRWLRQQPAEYVAKAAEASANWDAVRVVSIVRDFKAKTQPQRAAKDTRQTRLAAAAVPSGSNPSRRKLDELDGKAYWDELDRLERSRRLE